MAFRRIAASLLVGMAVLGACASGGDDGGGITFSDPVAEQDPQDVSRAATDAPAAVVKDAQVHMSVARGDLTSAAQQIVDLVVGPRVGGFLSRSVLDRDDGHGTANVLVKVPAFTFEDVVSELNQIGDVRRQFVQGDDRSEDFARARQKVELAEDRVESLLKLVDETDDAAARFDLRQRIAAAKTDLDTHRNDQSFLEAQTTFSTIDVYLTARPPVTPERPAIERATGTAKDITLAIASGLVLTAGVVLPIAVVLLPLYVIAARVRRRWRVRLES